MKALILSAVIILLAQGATAEQLSIQRIESMPRLPQPYEMRNWKQMARDYNSFVFNTSLSGTYLPLSQIGSTGSINFPTLLPLFMDTYVGHLAKGQAAEAINVMPAVIGASLVGINKQNDLGINWVEKMKAYFNQANGQNLYLNNFSATTGNDWWYEIMPNLFFMQLYSLYPDADPSFAQQQRLIADRMLEMIRALGGGDAPWKLPNFNYRAFNFSTSQPVATGVPEPETAGSVAWILYHAYLQTGDQAYLKGAEQALDYLNNLSTNPSYEIQLPYGIVAAARMNAVEGTNYQIGKFLDWSFSGGKNTLRGWGTIIGKWGEYDVSGLIGEANDSGNDYAFLMNGFQHAAALLPVAKYDKRYARALAKWMLNVSNASRLFYPDALSTTFQESASSVWSKAFDPQANIPFEALKERWNNKSPFAMGDAVRSGWAMTDLSLYSGASVGYMAALIEETNIDGILQIDLNRTDFNNKNSYPNYLYYNPYSVDKQVEMQVGSTPVNLYDALSETLLATGATGKISISIPADEARLVVLYPAKSSIQTSGRIRKVYGGGVIDYHYRYNYTNPLRIKSIAANKEALPSGESLSLYALVENGAPDSQIVWFVNDQTVDNTHTLSWNWVAPATVGVYSIRFEITSEYRTLKSPTLLITVAPEGMKPPLIKHLTLEGSEPYATNDRPTISTDLELNNATAQWTVSGGVLSGEESLTPTWSLPAESGYYSLTLQLKNLIGEATQTLFVLVKDLDSATIPTLPLLYYDFNGRMTNQSSDRFPISPFSTSYINDAKGNSAEACLLPSTTSYLRIDSSPELNTTQAISLSFWISPQSLGGNEQFVLSHGSWEERYKISITPERKLRWTLKTDRAIADIDDPEPLTANTFRHYTALYTGYSIELYRNGTIVAFKPLSGTIGQTSKAFTIGRKDELELNYTYQGAIDELRLYPYALPLKAIALLPSLWELTTTVDSPTTVPNLPSITPNPFTNGFQTVGTDQPISLLTLTSLSGIIVFQAQNVQSQAWIPLPRLAPGIYLAHLKFENGEQHISKVICH